MCLLIPTPFNFFNGYMDFFFFKSDSNLNCTWYLTILLQLGSNLKGDIFVSKNILFPQHFSPSILSLVDGPWYVYFKKCLPSFTFCSFNIYLFPCSVQKSGHNTANLIESSHFSLEKQLLRLSMSHWKLFLPEHLYFNFNLV